MKDQPKIPPQTIVGVIHDNDPDLYDLLHTAKGMTNGEFDFDVSLHTLAFVAMQLGLNQIIENPRILVGSAIIER